MDSELDLIARLRAVLESDAPAEGPARVVIASGDDAAVTVPPGATVTSVDSVVEGVHFTREAFGLRSIGSKALAGALSDLAAMGARAGEAYVQLGLPGPLSEEEADELASGLADRARETGVRVLGGDVTRAPALWIAVTVVGHAASEDDLVSRAGARPGDVVVVTGELGGAGAGLRLLEEPALGAELDPGDAAAMRSRQLEPRPRLAEGAALAVAGATSMIDLSDGLATDAAHVARASSSRLAIDAQRLPLAPGLEQLAAALGEHPASLAAAGGEDYELLATLPPDRIDAARELLGKAAATPITAIGVVEAGAGFSLRGPSGEEIPARPGFDHLAGSRSPSPGDRA